MAVVILHIPCDISDVIGDSGCGVCGLGLRLSSMSEWLVADGARDKFSTDLLWCERSARDSRNSSLAFKRDDMFWMESPDMEPSITNKQHTT